MADSKGLRLIQNENRISIGEIQMGNSQRQVLEIASREFSIEPQCKEQKVGNRNNKKAALEETCSYSDLTDIELFGHRLVGISYFFENAILNKIDVELEPKNENSIDEVVQQVSQSLNLVDKSNGMLHQWVGAVDAALLIQQGNLKLRVIPRAQLPENSKGPTIMNRS